MIVVNRFRVPGAATDFAAQARSALAVLATAPGFVSGDLGRNVDDPQLWTIVTRWQNVGSYRRALGGYEAKVTVVPLLSQALDEPTAYEVPEQVGPNQPRGAGCYQRATPVADR